MSPPEVALEFTTTILYISDKDEAMGFEELANGRALQRLRIGIYAGLVQLDV